MKKILVLSTVLALSSVSALSAQQITFRAEFDSVLVNGLTVGSDNRTDQSIFGLGFFVPVADFASFVASPSWSLETQGEVTLEELSRILTYITERPGFASVADIGTPPAAAPVGAGMLNRTLNPGAADFHAVFIIHDSPTGPAGLGAGSNFGVVATSFPSPAGGTVPIGFNSTLHQWDRFLVGDSGSIQLATVIPEPSTYAALFGIFALAGVMIRRRLRK
ncbi:MAG: PEP-CTERM sorting domain-containing protein [Opitutales bacterium]|nr:PEP-CTERM sorting domain-containing protein [Opitutales bacterium]